MKHLIALGHYSRTGKDTLAKILRRKLGGESRVKFVSFARPFKQHLFEMFAWAGLREPDFYDTPAGEPLRNVVLPALGLTPVELWIKFGDQMRDEYHPHIWVNIGKHSIETHLAADERNWCVITDFRFPYEWDMVRSADGVTVRILRPGVHPRDSRADRALLDRRDWDFTIHNNGSLFDLEQAADLLLAELHRADGTNREIEAKPSQTISCYELKEAIACL